MDEFFLTFLAITYRRPAKLNRLLRVFLDEKWQTLSALKMEIVIADDHSEDNTYELIKPTLVELEKNGWSVRYIYRPSNLRGDRNLYQGYAEDSYGKYVWFLCDDDILKIDAALKFIREVEVANPTIAICGFSQGIDKQISNDLGEQTRLIENFDLAVYWITKFPKTTSYLYKKTTINNFNDHLNRWDGTLFSWVGLAIFLFKNGNGNGDGKLLLFPEITAEADDEYLNLRYSYRVFGKLYNVVSDCYRFFDIPLSSLCKTCPHILISDEIVLCLQGLSAHYSYRSLSHYADKILKEEKYFLMENIFKVFIDRNRLRKFGRLIIIFFLSFFVRIARKACVILRV